jgi:TonB family protein
MTLARAALPRSPAAPAILLFLLASCGRSPVPATPSVPLAVQVMADTAHRTAAATEVPPPAVSVWLERVDRVRAAAVDPPLPDAAPDTTIPDSPPAPAIDPGLTPPVLAGPAPVLAPRDAQGAPLRGRVELDLQVSESGEVTRTRWAGGSADRLLVNAATACALGMRFHPALHGDQPVAVWCRQRFDFGAAGGR